MKPDYESIIVIIGCMLITILGISGSLWMFYKIFSGAYHLLVMLIEKI